jgi:acyl-CoA synthetase (AMP-forming)/AMP-acid ligase II
MCTAWGIASYVGATVALRKKFSASNFLKDVRKYGVTFTTYVGEIPRYLLNQPKTENDGNHTLKKMLGLGLKLNIWNEFKNRFNIEHIYEYYSSTEGYGPVVNFDEKPGMIGRNNISVHALAKADPETGEFDKDENGFLIKCKPGDIGISLRLIEEIDTFRKYTEHEKTKERVIQDVFEKGDAYFITGDLLLLHEDDWLSFADRFGDTFRWKGENVSTQEVENIINTYPSILHSAVYGVELPQKNGKAGMAALKLDPSKKLELDDFSRFIAEVLPSYSIPLFLRIRDDLEMTGSQKVRKVNLRRESYNREKIKEPMYFWNPSDKLYVNFDENIYNDIENEKLVL